MKKIWIYNIALMLIYTIVIGSCTLNKPKRIGSKKDDSIVLDTVVVTGKKSISNYKASEPIITDLIHTLLKVKFDFQKQYLYGEATITVKPHFKPQNILVLDAKGMNINSVTSSNGKTLSFDYRDSMHLIITLDKTYTKEEKYSIVVNYTSRPNELKVNGGTAITDNKGLYYINSDGKNKRQPTEVWTQGEVEANSCWFPTLDAPNQRTTQEIYMTVPDTMVTLSNGILISSVKNNDATRTDYWKQDKSHPPYLAVMIVGPFDITKDSWRGKEVSYYTEHEYTPYARDIFGNTPEMLEYFSKELGVDFAWDKYGQVIVREFVSGAMENTSAVTHFDALNKTKREMIDGNYETIIAHELFHHWFGDLVTCESWSNLTLNESFATYGEYLWVDHKYGREDADIEMLENRKKYFQEAETKQVDLVRFDYENPDDMFDRHSYEKGGCILHMLRDYLGDEIFFAGIKKYLTENQFKSAEVPQLRMAFEAVSGEDLNWFFNQWYYNSGHPAIDIKYTYVQDTMIIDVTQKNSNEGARVKYFRLPMKVDVYTSAGKESYDMLLYKGKQQFKYIAKEKPLLVNVDANKVFLADITENKTGDWYQYQYLYATVFRDRYDAVEYFIKYQKDEKIQSYLQNALNDKHWYIRKRILDKINVNNFSSTDLITKIKELATQDPHSLVRASAIDKLSKLKNKENISIYEIGIKDSSYKVIGTSLSAISNIDSTKAMKYAKTFESESNSSIVNGVADVYSSWGNASSQNYYEQKLDEVDGYTQIQLLYHYVNYLGKMNKPEFDKAIPTYENLLETSSSEYMPVSISGSLKRLKNYYERRKKSDENSSKDLPKGDLKALNDLTEQLNFYTDAVRKLDAIILKAKNKMEGESGH
jgi:aminopeptidase N